MADMHKELSQGEESQREIASYPFKNKVLMCGVISCSTLRAFVFAGLEVASAMILEVEHGWGTKAAGLAISVTFLNVIPLHWIFKKNEERLEPQSWLRILWSASP